MNLDYRITFINDEPRLRTFCESLASVAALALDLETINWWLPRIERVALIQLAYRLHNHVRVAVIDALAPLDLSMLRQPLELNTVMKVMHNAAFGALHLIVRSNTWRVCGRRVRRCCFMRLKIRRKK